MSITGFWRLLMTGRCCTTAVVLVLTLAAPALAQESTVAGRIKVVSGSAFIVRNNQLVAAKLGDLVREADGLRTGADGRIGVTMNDDTRISLGPSSEVLVERFVYAPGEGRLAFALKLVRGLTAYVSGRIAKLAPDAIRLETPNAIIGVRGTSLAIRVES
jgi:hypothetical protein